MKIPNDQFKSRGKRLLTAVGFFPATLTVILGIGHAMPGRAQSQAQNSAAAAPVFEYEVASIKPSKPDATGGFMTIPGPGDVSDTYAARNLPLMGIIREAYGIPMGAEDGRLVGAPGWLSSERYDIEAKIDRTVVEELQKLSPEVRVEVQQQMLQALLADRLKLSVHRESKEVPVYSLVVAKNGSKLQESKPSDADANATPAPGRGGRGGSSLAIRGRGGPLTGQAVPITMLVTVLTTILKRPVLDKTGLTGNYDFTLTWTPDDTQLQTPRDAPNGQPPLLPPDPNGPSIFTAIQEQLGLKLESGKGSVRVIVIDHVERPSGN